jgi:hypothetical protein
MSRALAVVCLMSLLLGGCVQTVSMPTSDSTPPTLKWSVFDEAAQTMIDPVNGQVQAQAGRTYLVTLNAQDPEGLHRVMLASTQEWDCTDGTVTVHTAPLLGPPQTRLYTADPHNQVPTGGALNQEIKFSPSPCDPGLHIANGVWSFEGQGENFFGGTTTAFLKVLFPH